MFTQVNQISKMISFLLLLQLDNTEDFDINYLYT